MKPFKRVVLHIGGEKTGSTRLQQTLQEQRDYLLQVGIYTPLTGNMLGNCWGFAALAQHDPKRSFFLQMNPDASDHIAGCDDLMSQYQLEFGGVGSDYETLLISSEHLQTVVNIRGITRLFDWLETLTDRVQIVYVVRRQDQIMRSLLTTILRGNASPAVLLNENVAQRLESPRLNHWLAISRYLMVSTNLKVSADVVSYSSGERLAQMDARLRSLIGLPNDLTLPTTRSNPALRERTTRFMSTLLHPALGNYHELKQAQRREVASVLAESDSSQPFLPPKRWAESIIEPFKPSNNRSREMFLPTESSLFLEGGLKIYPDIENYSLGMNREEFMGVIDENPELASLLPALRTPPPSDVFDQIIRQYRLS